MVSKSDYILKRKFLADISLFKTLNKEIQWEQQYYGNFLNKKPIPRLTCWYGDKTYSYSGVKNTPIPFTDNILQIKQEIENYHSLWHSKSYEYNSCLANLYRDGKDSVDFHSDDEKELGKYPVIASISFGAKRAFQVRDKITKELLETIWLEDGDLIIMLECFQEKYEHSIPKPKSIINPRINLTFRYIN